ncbi:NAD(P)H-binding protein [Brevibacterium sp. 2SA]|uniref:SDR family oxidoreductase n=1 Tax=Brevibacterium sp. 2SA TaxID=2502198 RepID=UPI0010F7A645|nr:NAD(P)H-binding protein [Brevibacterium sp. 2SA]
MKILITGASGRVGGHVTRFLADSHEVTATTRSYPPRGAHQVAWRKADLADPEPWTALLNDVDAAFLFPAFGHTQHFIDAATRVGLPKLVLLSSGAVSDSDDSMIKSVHADIEEQARASGVATVRVRPTVFMANDLAWLPAVKSGEAVPLAYPHAAMPAVAEQDIAAVIAACLTQDVDSEIYDVTGPQSLTQVERLQIIANHVTGADARWADITDDAERDGLPGMPGPPGEYLLRNLARAADEPAPVSFNVQRILGREALDYTRWINEVI